MVAELLGVPARQVRVTIGFEVPASSRIPVGPLRKVTVNLGDGDDDPRVATRSRSRSNKRSEGLLVSCLVSFSDLHILTCRVG